MAKKPVIANVARPQGWKDDAAKAAAKAAKKAVQKKASKAMKDVADPKYTKKVYNKKGGLTKDYKDYVMKNMRGFY